MSHPAHWQYPSSGPAPPSPHVVDPTYPGGRPTPPPSPVRMRAIPTINVCPPTPRCVPSSVYQDELECNCNTLSESDYWSVLNLDDSTSFADPLVDETLNDQTQYGNSATTHVSDCLIYDRETYAYPSPVLAMIARATFDMNGLETQPVDPWACGEAFTLFSLSAGYIPVTGLANHDKQSFDYYTKLPDPSLPRESESSISYRFPISTIQAVQHELRTKWLSVYPEPIPPVIVRLNDIVGPYYLNRREDGYAFVVPAEDSIWATVLQRGIDSTYRPIDPSAVVESGMCTKGAALYHPQHIVASKFAVNVFFELPDTPGLTPRCEYMGAYVLRVMDGLTINRSIWADIEPRAQRFVFDRVPDYFEGHRHPSLGWPLLPYVHFSHYKWDESIIGLADEVCNRIIIETRRVIAQRWAEGENVDSDDSSDSSDYSDSGFDTDHTTSTFSVYSDGQGYTTSFLNLSPCA